MQAAYLNPHMFTESSGKQDHDSKKSDNEAKQTGKSRIIHYLIIMTEKPTAVETY